MIGELKVSAWKRHLRHVAKMCIRDSFRQAVKSAPAFTDGWINLAATLALEKHFLEAQEAVANALRLEPTNAQALQLSQDLNAAAQR